MNLQDAVVKLLREQTDNTNVVELLWLMFARHVGVPPGGVQWRESRRCFFAGAATLFECFQRIMEPGEEPTDDDIRRVDLIAKELERFYADMGEGRS